MWSFLYILVESKKIMAFGLIPLAGLALGGIAALVNRRRQARAGAAFGRAINTQPQGPPTNPISQAATSDPAPQTMGTGGVVGRPGPPPGPQAPAIPTTIADPARIDPHGADWRRQQGPGTNAPGRGQQGGLVPVTRQLEVTPPLSKPETPRQQSPAAPDLSGLGAQMGRRLVARSRRKNIEQQATLSGAAIS